MKTDQPCSSLYQEKNRVVNSYLISTIAVATIVMVGVLIAARCSPSTAGMMTGIYVGTGIFGTALLASIFARCIERTAPPPIATTLDTIDFDNQTYEDEYAAYLRIQAYFGCGGTDMYASENELTSRPKALLVKWNNTLHVAHRSKQRDRISSCALIYYIPVMNVENDFNPHEIPEGKKLYVNHEQTLKIATCQGFASLTSEAFPNLFDNKENPFVCGTEVLSTRYTVNRSTWFSSLDKILADNNLNQKSS